MIWPGQGDYFTPQDRSRSTVDHLHLDTHVKCLTTAKKWHDEIQDTNNKMVHQETKTRARGSSVLSGSKHLDFRVY